MTRLPAGKPASANCPAESVTTNFLTSGAEMIPPAMGRPLKSEIAAPRMRALVSERARACTDDTSMAAATAGKVIMLADHVPAQARTARGRPPADPTLRGTLDRLPAHRVGPLDSNSHPLPANLECRERIGPVLAVRL